jgi:hypothetical protein
MEKLNQLYLYCRFGDSFFMSNLFHGSLKKIKSNNKYSYLEYFQIENNTLMGTNFRPNLFHIPLAPYYINILFLHIGRLMIGNTR